MSLQTGKFCINHLIGCKIWWVGIEQDAIYHAEGDVAVHTKMVLEAFELA